VSDEKPFDPTPARIARARRDGNVPRPTELVAAAAFGASAIAACAVVAPIGALARDAIASAARGTPSLRDEGAVVALAALPMLCGAAFACVATVAQRGGIAATPLCVKLARLDPAEGARRMFSRDTAVHAVRAVLAFAAAVAGMTPAISHAIVAVGAGDLGTVAANAWDGARRTLAVACSVGALFALWDHVATRRAWLRTLRMSFDELKREVKDQEGDPHLRSRRKTRHRALARGAVSAVKEAAFVVANPTHVAVALAYRPPAIAVPTVLVRAADAAALRVRALAERFGVPVVEHPSLARALFAQARIGAAIPSAHYVAVAEIVAVLARGERPER
jgi:flagellar biosynthesis protein FlhB